MDARELIYELNEFANNNNLVVDSLILTNKCAHAYLLHEELVKIRKKIKKEEMKNDIKRIA